MLPIKPLRCFCYRAASWKLKNPADSMALLTAALLTAMLSMANAFTRLPFLMVMRGRDLDPFRP